MTTPPLDLNQEPLDRVQREVDFTRSFGGSMNLRRDDMQAVLDRLEAAEAAVARVEAICQDTDGNWLDPEDECNNVGGILQAVRGDGA